MSIFRASETYNLIGRARSDKSALSDAVKKYIRSKWLEHNKAFRPPVTAKQLTKGILMELEAIDFYSHHIFADPPLEKCEESKEIPELKFSGTCDINHDGQIIMDMKCPWDASGFMESDFNQKYEWQLRGYMMLYEVPKARLVYCLMDIPDDLFEDEWRRFCWNNNIVDDSTLEAQEQRALLESMYYYSNNPLYTDEERIKVYEIDRDPDLEDHLKESLKLALEYYESLTLNIPL